MSDPAIIVLISAALLVGAIVGVVALLTWLGVVVHKVARASAIYAPDVPRRPAGFVAPLDPVQASASLHQGELEAADALEGFRAAQNGPQEASQAATGDFRGKSKAPGCGYCKKLRKAIFG